MDSSTNENGQVHWKSLIIGDSLAVHGELAVAQGVFVLAIIQ